MQPGIIAQNTREETFHERQLYLHQIGLEWDPFIIPVAEQELALAGWSPQNETDQMPSPEVSSLAYFIPPQNPCNPEQSLLAALRQSRTAFVFGEPGSGKTSLRLALEATCRRVSDRSLVVSYLLGQDVAGILTAADHRQRLSRQLAIDAFIQIIEQFKPGIDTPTDKQHLALAQLIQIGGRPLQRLVCRLIKEPEPEGLLGLAERWRSVGRLPVRHVARSPEMLSLLQCALAQAPEAVPESGKSTLPLGLGAARAWGFEKVFVLVDGVDTWWRDPDKMLGLITPLLEETAVWQTNQLFCKYFLPQNLRHLVENFINQNPLCFTHEAFMAELNWDKAALRQLLKARFRAAGSRRVSLDDLASVELAEQLDELLLEEAQGSPRRFLQLISALIDVHVQMSGKRGEMELKEQLISREEWAQAATYVAQQFA